MKSKELSVDRRDKILWQGIDQGKGIKAFLKILVHSGPSNCEMGEV